MECPKKDPIIIYEQAYNIITKAQLLRLKISFDIMDLLRSLRLSWHAPGGLHIKIQKE